MTAWATAYLTKVKVFPKSLEKWRKDFRGVGSTREETQEMLDQHKQIIDDWEREQAETDK